MALAQLAASIARRARLPGPATASSAGAGPALGDFTIDPRVLQLIGMALVVGSLGAGAAWLLLKLIILVTNLAYYGRFTTATLSIAGTPLGPLDVFVPIAGCILVGLM